MKKRFFLFSILIFNFAFAQEKWNIHSELSYVKTSGNSDTETFAVKAEAKKDNIANRYNLKGEFLYGKTDNKENTNKFYLDGKWEKLLIEKLFWFIQGDYLKDRFSGFDYRTVWSAGLGYDFIKKDNYYLKGLISIGYAFEDLKEKGSNDYTSGKIEFLYYWKVTKNLKFKEEISYLQSFKEQTVYYINSLTGIEAKINSHFSLGISYKVDYQHSPANENIEKTDITFLTSLIYDY